MPAKAKEQNGQDAVGESHPKLSFAFKNSPKMFFILIKYFAFAFNTDWLTTTTKLDRSTLFQYNFEAM